VTGNVNTGMRRGLVVLAIAVVAIGGALAYVGTRDHKTAQRKEHLPGAPSLAGDGFAVGRMHVSGGPVRLNGETPDSPVAGEVAVRHPRNPTIVATVGVDVTGSFRIALPPGNYELVARPTNPISPFNSDPFSIQAGRTTEVDLVAIAT
jgi:hypothetical protein